MSVRIAAVDASINASAEMTLHVLGHIQCNLLPFHGNLRGERVSSSDSYPPAQLLISLHHAVLASIVTFTQVDLKRTYILLVDL